MDVIFGTVGIVEIDDEFNVVHIYAITKQRSEKEYAMLMTRQPIEREKKSPFLTKRLSRNTRNKKNMETKVRSCVVGIFTLDTFEIPLFTLFRV